MSNNSWYISSDSDDEPFSKLSVRSTSKQVKENKPSASEIIFGVKTRNNRYKVSDAYRKSTKGGKRRKKTVKRRRR